MAAFANKSAERGVVPTKDESTRPGPVGGRSNAAQAGQAERARRGRVPAPVSFGPSRAAGPGPALSPELASPVTVSSRRVEVSAAPGQTNAARVTFTALEACELTTAIGAAECFELASPAGGVELAANEEFTAVVRFAPRAPGTYRDNLTALCVPIREGDSIVLDTTLEVELIGNAETRAAPPAKAGEKAGSAKAGSRDKADAAALAPRPKAKEPAPAKASEAARDAKAEAIAAELINPPSVAAPEHASKAAALQAIQSKIPIVFDSGSDGIAKAGNAIQEIPPPADPGVAEALLDVAIGVAIAASAGAIGAAAARGLREAIPSLAKSSVPDALKDGLKSAYKSGLSALGTAPVSASGTLGRAVQYGVDNARSRAKGETPKGDAMQRMPMTYFLNEQRHALTMAKANAADHLARTWSELEKLDLAELNAISVALHQTLGRKVVLETQFQRTLTEWVNFCARLKFGAPAETTRDAALVGLSEEELAHATGILRVEGKLSFQSGPRAVKFSLPGVNKSVAGCFNQKRLGDVSLNKLISLDFESDRIGSPSRIPLEFSWHPDAQSIQLHAGSPWSKGVLIAYGRGYERPADRAGTGGGFFDHQLIELYEVYGDAEAVNGAHRIIDDLAEAKIAGLG